MSHTAPKRPSWWAHPELVGVRVCRLTFGGDVLLGHGDAGQPPGVPGDPVGYSVTWCRLEADPEDWPYQGWFRLPGPLDGWAMAVTRSGGLLPADLQVAYWRAYAQVLEAELQEMREVHRGW